MVCAAAKLPLGNAPQWIHEVYGFSLAVLTFAIVFGAFAANVLYGAMRAVPRGQIETAEAYGMTRRQAFWRILVPQMWVYALPGLSNLWMVLIKATPLLFLLGVEDIVYWARELGGTKNPRFTDYPHGDWRLWYFLALLVFLPRLHQALRVRAGAHHAPPHPWSGHNGRQRYELRRDHLQLRLSLSGLWRAPAAPHRFHTLCEHFTLIGSGMIWNVYFGLFALAFGFFLATAIALAKASKSPWVRKPAEWFILVFRGSPLFIQFFLAYLIFLRLKITFPALDWLTSAWAGALVVLFLNTAAYSAEIFYGALRSIPKRRYRRGGRLWPDRLDPVSPGDLAHHAAARLARLYQ